MSKFNSNSVKFFAAVVLCLGVASAANAATFSSPIDTAQERMDVQTVLNANGASLTVDGKFGPKTMAAVKAFQTSKGLVADGKIGPMTRAALNAAGGSVSTGGALCPNGMTLASNCTAAPSTTGGSTSGVSLNGTFGTISEMNQISSLNNEEIGSGQKNIQVAGFDAKTSKDGDVNVSSIKLTFDSTGNNAADSDRISDYLSNIYVWMGSTKIGSASTSDFTKDSTGVYSKTIQLSGAVIKADKTEKFYISADAVSNLDSGDIDSDSWTVAINNIRYVDGSGVTTTEDSGGSLIPAAMDYDTAGDGVGISFVSFSTAADTELKINVDSSLQAGIVTVNTTSDTKGVTLLKGTMKLEGTSNVWLDEVPFLFTTNATNVDAVTPTVYFTIDGTEYSESMTSSAGTTEVITFNDLNKTLTAGKTYTFTVKADVNDIQVSEFDEGDYLSADLDSTRRALVIAENDQGDQLTDGTEMTGVASGTIQYFYSIAPTVEVVSASITPNDNGSSAATSATAKLKLKLTAKGGTVYLNGDDESTGAKELITLTYDGGDATTSVSSYTYTTSGTYTTTNGGADNEYYTLNDGDVMYVDITAVVARGAGGSTTILTGLKGTAVLFGTDSTSDTTRSTNSLSFTALTDLLKSGLTSLSRTSA